MDQNSPGAGPAHRRPAAFQDRIARGIARSLRTFANILFSRRYGHRAIVLETVAAVPGMVGGLIQHLRALRRMESDDGWIRALLDEAENERMHLMTFVALYRPTAWERLLVITAQALFFSGYLVLYLVSARTAHRLVAYLEEEAIESYTQFLALIDAGEVDDVAAPLIAERYWKLEDGARLAAVITAIREDERHHCYVNHACADELTGHDVSRTPSIGRRGRE